MGGKNMNAERYEKIVTDRLVFGKPAKQIAAELGIGETAVFTTLSAFNDVKEQNWSHALAMLTNQNVRIGLFEWASERLGIELPQSLTAAYNQRLAKMAQLNREKRARQKADEAPEPTVEPEEEPTPEPPKPEKPDNTSLYLLKMLEAINQQNELLSQLMDAVIPKYVGDLKDNVNANCDSLFNQIKDNGEKLEAVKINTRKRGL